MSATLLVKHAYSVDFLPAESVRTEKALRTRISAYEKPLLSLRVLKSVPTQFQRRLCPATAIVRFGKVEETKKDREKSAVSRRSERRDLFKKDERASGPCQQ